MRFCKLGIKYLWQVFTLFILVNISVVAFAEQLPKLNMHYGVTPISKDIYNLHMTVFWVCVAIGIVVFSLLMYAIIMHRKSRVVKPARFHGHQTVEIIWAIVPLVILIIMAIPATIVLMRMSNTDDSAITIKITGYQWKWQYSYLDQGIEFFSNLKTPLDQIHNKVKKDKWYLLEVDKPLIVPINEKVRFLITSNDVIHSWWVPSLGVKKDAMPGFIHEAWVKIEKPGIYRGQCAELCGVYHGYMPIVVEAVSKQEFNDWVEQERALEENQQAEQLAQKNSFTKLAEEKKLIDNHTIIKATGTDAAAAAKKIIVDTDKEMPVNKTYTANELMEKGQDNYNKYCAACHQEDGKGIPPIYPALHADSVAVGGSIIRHIDIVLNGIPGTAMQAFGPQLSDFDIASIVTYERNAWENRTGDFVQPQQVAEQRAKFFKEKDGAEVLQMDKDLKEIKQTKE